VAIGVLNLLGTICFCRRWVTPHESPTQEKNIRKYLLTSPTRGSEYYAVSYTILPGSAERRRSARDAPFDGEY
jgi:hypothetical protein